MSDTGRQARTLKAQGVPTIEIARWLDVAQSTVHYRLRAPAADAPPPAPAPAADPVAAASSTGVDPCGQVRTRELVALLLAEGMSRAQVAARLGLSKATISYHARRLGVPVDERCRRRYDWAAIQAHHDAGHTVRACADRFGFSLASWHEASKRGQVVARQQGRSLEQMFAPDTHRHRGQLKQRLVRAGLKEYRCERCSVSEWREHPLALALHHRNGDRLDNRVENLELLCPNCHSQTDTFSGRNGPRRAPES